MMEDFCQDIKPIYLLHISQSGVSFVRPVNLNSSPGFGGWMEFSYNLRLVVRFWDLCKPRHILFQLQLLLHCKLTSSFFDLASGVILVVCVACLYQSHYLPPSEVLGVILESKIIMRLNCWASIAVNMKFYQSQPATFLGRTPTYFWWSCQNVMKYFSLSAASGVSSYVPWFLPSSRSW